MPIRNRSVVLIFILIISLLFLFTPVNRAQNQSQPQKGNQGGMVLLEKSLRSRNLIHSRWLLEALDGLPMGGSPMRLNFFLLRRSLAFRPVENFYLYNRTYSSPRLRSDGRLRERPPRSDKPFISADNPEFRSRRGMDKLGQLKYVPGIIVVKFREGLTVREVRKTARSLGGRILRSSRFSDFELIEIPETMTVPQAVKLYAKQPDVVYAEPNYYRYSTFRPSDPYYSYQWHFQQIDIESAWDINFGSDPSVIVAVIDSGVAFENYKVFKQAPDLAGTRFVPGFDFVDDDRHPNDEGTGDGFGHGTWVTGIIAQTTNNGLGVAGIAFNATIMPLRVLDATGSGTSSDEAEAIRFATLNGARVINLSLGGEEASQAEHEAVRFAYHNGVVLVAAAGNERDEPEPPSDVCYPARYEEVLAVGATDYLRQRTYYSNGGPGLDVVAPGGDMTVDSNDDGFVDGVLQQSFLAPEYDKFYYFFTSGTSGATPHVAGIVAMLISQYGITDPEVIYDAIRYTAIDQGPPGRDDGYGYGLVNARDLLLGLGINR